MQITKTDNAVIQVE